MNPRSPSVSLANGYASNTIARQGLSAASWADSRASTLCLTALIATLWLATHPYMGVILNSRFYTVQTLSALLPGRFADDLYFRYGSQGQFTLFTLAYKPLLATFGTAKAAMILTVFGQGCWVCGLIYLSRGIFRDSRSVRAAVVAAIVLPGGVMFSYGELFLTPRLFAEAATLWALGAMLRGRSVRALVLLVCSAAIHPIMTLPGFAVLFLYEASRQRVWWVLGALAVVVLLGLAFAGVQPFVRIFESFDPAWFAVVRVRDFFCLLTQWTPFDWLKTCNMFALAALGLSLAEPRERRFIAAVTAVAVGGLAVALLGGDLFHNVLIIDAQQYRATWLLAVVANLFAGPLLLRLRGNGRSSVTTAALTLAIGTLVLTRFLSAGYLVATPMIVCAGFALAWRGPIPARARTFGILIVGAMCGMALLVLYSFTIWIEDAPSLFWQITRGLGLTIAALAIVVHLNASADARSSRAVTYPLTVFAVGLFSIAVLNWDQRTPWTKFVETADAAPEPLSSWLLNQKSVYWEGDVRVPWFVLKRPSYFSCAQGTGSLFFRNTAVSYQHRYEIFQQLRTLDFGQDPACPSASALAVPSADRDELASICASEPDLDALVLTRPLASPPMHIWVSPVRFEDIRPIDGRLRVFSTNEFFVYSCAVFR